MQITIYGVWVTSTGHMEDLLEQLVGSLLCCSVQNVRARHAPSWTCHVAQSPDWLERV